VISGRLCNAGRRGRDIGPWIAPKPPYGRSRSIRRARSRGGGGRFHGVGAAPGIAALHAARLRAQQRAGLRTDARRHGPGHAAEPTRLSAPLRPLAHPAGAEATPSSMPPHGRPADGLRSALFSQRGSGSPVSPGARGCYAVATSPPPWCSAWRCTAWPSLSRCTSPVRPVVADHTARRRARPRSPSSERLSRSARRAHGSA
jgi:hypothetical protein